jgi:hypothetical protein
MTLFQEQRFAEAEQLFREAEVGFGDGRLDVASGVYARRSAELAQSPPGPEWDGVYRPPARETVPVTSPAKAPHPPRCARHPLPELGKRAG